MFFFLKIKEHFFFFCFYEILNDTFFFNYGFTLGAKVHINTGYNFCRLKDHFIQCLSINSVFKRNISGFFTSVEGKQIVSKQKIDNFYT